MATRQLAAIMFSDIVGYTTLMGENTDKALKLVEKSREIQKPLVKQYNGKWIKDMGDGAMISFSSALDAVNCAYAIQRESASSFDGHLRIGIHLGDIQITDDDVLGDGVNVASRLESIADPGGIYISESVEKAIRGQSTILTRFLGEIKLKNVDYNVRTYAIQGEYLPVPKVEKGILSGHLSAELSRRGLFRTGITYLILSLLLILLVGELQSLLSIPEWSISALLTVLLIGLPVSLLLAWNFEWGPGGFIRTTSKQSWRNPLDSSQRKPLTGRLAIGLLAVLVAVVYFLPEEEPDDEPIKIAVIPLVSLAENPDLGNFSISVTQEIIDELSKVSKFRLSPFTLTRLYANVEMTPEAIGKELGVDYILAGNSRVDKTHVRLSVELIDVLNNEQLWTNRFDEELTQSMRIQNSVAKSIVNELNISLSHSEQENLDRLSTPSHEAYALYMLARSEYVKLKMQSFAISIKHLEEAIALDPNYAKAYTLMGFIKFLNGVFANFAGLQDPLSASKDVYTYLYKAIELDPTNPDNYLILAGADLYLLNDLESAKESIEQSISMASYTEELTDICLCIPLSVFSALNDTTRTNQFVNISKTMDPLNLFVYAFEAMNEYHQGNYNEAIRIASTPHEMIPDNIYFAYELGWMYYNTKDYENTIKLEQRSVALSGGKFPMMLSLGVLSNAYYKVGKQDSSNFYYDELIKYRNKKYSNTFLPMAMIEVARGNYDNSIAYIDSAQRAPDVNLHWSLTVDPVFDPIRDDPRFIEIFERPGFDRPMKRLP